MNKLHVEGVFPTSLTPEVTKIGPDGAASLLGSFPLCDTVCTFGPKTTIRPPLDNPPGLHVGRRPLLLDP